MHTNGAWAHVRLEHEDPPAHDSLYRNGRCDTTDEVTAMAAKNGRRVARDELGNWIGDGDELVLLESRQLAALTHWARIGIERGYEDAKTLEIAAASEKVRSEGGLFTVDGLHEVARSIRDSAATALAVIALLELAEHAIVPVDGERLADETRTS